MQQITTTGGGRLRREIHVNLKVPQAVDCMSTVTTNQNHSPFASAATRARSSERLETTAVDRLLSAVVVAEDTVAVVGSDFSSSGRLDTLIA